MKTEDDADIESVDQEADQEKYESGREDPDELQINEGDVTEDDKNFNRFCFSMKDSIHH